MQLGIHKHISASRLSLTLFIANLIGAIVYVYAASPSWAIPEERAHGVHSVTGEPFIWAARALPIFVSFSLLDFLWGAYICIRREWQSGYIWLATFIIWLIAVWFDFAHH
jgi:accessory gene regulator protein AgrB